MDRSDCWETVKPATEAVPPAGPETEAREAPGEQPAPLPVGVRDDWRESCLSDFRRWLYDLTDDELEATLQGGAVDGEAYGAASEAEGPEVLEPDLETLFGELAALRQETDLMSERVARAEARTETFQRFLEGLQRVLSELPAMP